MQQKLTTLVLLSTVISIGSGASAEASSTLSTKLAKGAWDGLVDRELSVQIEPVIEAENGFSSDMPSVGLAKAVEQSNTTLLSTPLEPTTIKPTIDAESTVSSSSEIPSIGLSEEIKQSNATPLSTPLPPEEIGGLNARHTGVVISQQIPATPPPADSFPETLPEPEPEPDSAPVLPTTPEAPAPAESAEPTPGTGPTVTVQKFEVLGSTVFDDADFDTVLSRFMGRALDINELREAADSITQLYLDEGYITSRAVLPNQPITDGIVKLQVIEGSLEEIRIEQADRLARYVRSRINLGAKTPLNQFDLEDQLRLLRADPLIDNIEASLRAGTGLGQSILSVRIDEADPFEAHLTLDTDSPVSVGVVRMGANVTYRNPFGIGDQLRAAAFRATTGGSVLYELSYSAPINPMNGTISARFLPSEFDIITPRDLADLSVEGDAQVYELTYRQPLVRNPREEFALSLGFRHRDGDTQLLGQDFTSTSTTAIQFGQDYLRRDPKGAWALRSQFSLGVDLLDATNLPSPLADSQFVSWLGQVQRAQVLNQDHLLIAQADVQVATDTLLGSDQFVIGGRQSVRGYSQNARFGDNGVRVSVEDRITVQRNEAGVPTLLLRPFLDTAAVFNTRSGTTIDDDRFLLGTGVGFTYRPLEGLDLRLDLGVPLVDIDDSAPQDVFIYLDFDYEL